MTNHTTHDAAAKPMPQSALTGLFSIPFGVSFLEGLATAILKGNLPQLGGAPPAPIDLPSYTLLLPTRRAERALSQAFLKVSGERAMLLPQIRAVSDRNDDEAFLSSFAEPTGGGLVMGGSAAGEAGRDDSVRHAPLPPPIPPLERQMVLMTLVGQWSERVAAANGDGLGPAATPAARSPAQVAALAGELGQMLDLIETEQVSLDALAEIVPEGFSTHWEQTLGFLEIITQFWPAYRSAVGGLTAAERRNALILAEAERLRSTVQSGPVIVAGVTGSIPATVELMSSVLALEQGAVVLPGFDPSMDQRSWDVLLGDDRAQSSETGTLPVSVDAQQPPRLKGHPDHPQFAMCRLLHRLGAGRDDVVRLPLERTETLSARGAFLTEAMRPTATTEQWHTWLLSADKQNVEDGLKDVHLLETANALEEAEAIALILRECVETPGKRVALVTPDRLLARRIAIRLAAWNIRVDDSAGRPFAKTVPGAFLDLVIDVMDKNFEPAPLMAMLKHPLCRLGLAARDVRMAARAVELLAFRTVYTGSGLDGIRAALNRIETADLEGRRLTRAARGLSDDVRKAAFELVDQLEAAFAPLVALYGTRQPQSISACVTAHVMAAEALCRTPDDETADGGNPTDDDQPTTENSAGEVSHTDGGSVDAEPDLFSVLDAGPKSAASSEAGQSNALYSGEAGLTAATLLSQIIEAGEQGPPVHPRDYADLYGSLVSGNNVLPRVAVHPQISILGIMEARLIDADVMVLGGLNDGVWPDHADPGPWLNRPMRAELGLPDLEEKTGYAAHDFISFLAAPKVYLTRSKKTDGVPTVPSRWLMRVQALLRGLGLNDALDADRPWIGWARYRDKTLAERRPVLPPKPCPPLAARPRQIGVSKIETWMANPYAIFAQRILGLERLPDLGHAPDASLRGMIVHAAMSQFSTRYPDSLPADIAAVIMQASADHFGDLRGSPRVWAFWRPRLQRFAQWFSETEPARRDGVLRSLAEVDGMITLEAPVGPFKLTARADRIDLTDAGAVITDYKTGTAPSKKHVESGRRPQLPLEAAILIAGGFGLPDVGAGTVRSLRYISATGAEPAGVETHIADEGASGLADMSVQKLTDMIARFDHPETPYAALRRPGFNYDYDDYAQLARVHEWSVDDGSGDV